MAYKLLTVVEIEGVDNDTDAQARLDAYREQTFQEADEHGLTLYRATREDVKESGVLDQVSPLAPVESAFIKPWVAGDLDEEPGRAADKTFQEFDFDDAVEDSNGWERIIGGGQDEFTRVVFLEDP